LSVCFGGESEREREGEREREKERRATGGKSVMETGMFKEIKAKEGGQRLAET